MTMRKILFCAMSLIAASPESASGKTPNTTLRSSGKTANTTLQCTAIGMSDIVLMRARFETARGGLRTFSAGFEAIPGRRFAAGQRMLVITADVKVGTLKLKPIVGGHVAGEIQLADVIAFGTPVKPFPMEFPKLGHDTRVVVKAADDRLLECQLR